MKKSIIIKLFPFVLAVLCMGCQSLEKSNEDLSKEMNEKYRPQYHFSPQANWMNDPNGMVFYEGEYHLFYQYFPDSTVWGPMHWGHAVSTDMVQWEHLPIALFPDSLGYIFSGSAVVDWNNTSGFGDGNIVPLVAIFTHHDMDKERNGVLEDEVQSLAYSLDKGRTWTKYVNNPVIENPGIGDFRDPNVIWHETEQKWIMALAVLDHVNFYSSPDLKTWTLESEFGHNAGGHGGVWECPDLFPLLDPDGNEKWVLLLSINPGGPQGGSATQYFIGDFDGLVFTPADSVTRWVDLGADNYAGVTWSDIPKSDGRRLLLGWMSNWQYAQVVPTENWRSAMTVPRELILKNDERGYFLASQPVVELNTLHQDTSYVKTRSFNLENETFRLNISNCKTDAFEISFSNELNEKLIVGFKNSQLFIDRSNAGDASFSEVFAAIHSADFPNSRINSIQIFMDRSSIEVFIHNGDLVMTDLVFPTSPFNKLDLGGLEVTSKVELITLKGLLFL